MNTLKTISLISMITLTGIYSLGAFTLFNAAKVKPQTQQEATVAVLSPTAATSPAPTLASPTVTSLPKRLPTRIVIKKIPRPTSAGGASSSVASNPQQQQQQSQQQQQQTAQPQQQQQQPASQPTSPPAPTADNRCIIVVSGSRYDVTQFRNMHSGGNIFSCGADMTATFWGQHNQATLDRMAQYRI